MKILALESYFGGSHKAFLHGWIKQSSHDWTLLSLPPYKWKWRMRHAAVTFAQQAEKLSLDQDWDLIFCSDMLNLAEFIGLSTPKIQKIPALIYFHENQLTYPVRCEKERDYQFAVTNMTSALAAKNVWFNSAFHRDSFLDALNIFLKKMPDSQPFNAIDTIMQKSTVHPPGVDITQTHRNRPPGPLKILWAARWEHDKNPDDFFKAVKILKNKNIDFRLSVIGEQFRDAPEVFNWAQKYFDHWGFAETREKYLEILSQADVFVSTANHEFFGLSAIEAALAGAWPILPRRLAYPEIFPAADNGESFFYDGSVTQLAHKLIAFAKRVEKGTLSPDKNAQLAKSLEIYQWKNLAPKLDKAAADVAGF
jgi:glycosyltransferase involved in cell wall biosynthesis